MTQLFLIFAGISLEAGVLLAILLPLSRWARGRFPAKRLRLVWGVLALRLLVPVRLEMQIPMQVSLKEERPAAVQQLDKSAEGEEESPPAAPVGTVWLSEGTFPSEQDRPDVSVDVVFAAAAVWILGAGALLLWEFGRYVRLQREIRRDSREPREETARIYRELCDQMGLQSPPRLCILASAPGPLVIGLFSSSLILPVETYSRATLLAVFRHELSHVRRGDLWYKLLLTAVRALHWFNPLLWMMVRRADFDLELSCDEAAVCGEGIQAHREYGAALLDALREQKKGGVRMAAPFYKGKQELKIRLASLLKETKKGGRGFVAIAAAASLLCGVWSGCTVQEIPAGKVSSSAQGNIVRLSALYQYKMDSMETLPHESNIPILSLVSELPADGLELREIDYSQNDGKSLSLQYWITEPEKVFVDNTITADVSYRSAGILLSLVKNLEEVKISYQEEDLLGQGGTVTYTYTYNQDIYPIDLKDASSSQQKFTQLLLILGSGGIDSETLSQLYAQRVEYVGSAPAVGKLLSLLPDIQGDSYAGMSLSTSEQPYTLTLFYSFKQQENMLENEVYSSLYVNSGLLLSLVKNLDRVEIQCNDPQGQTEPEYVFMRGDYPPDVKTLWDSEESFQQYWGSYNPQ